MFNNVTPKTRKFGNMKIVNTYFLAQFFVELQVYFVSSTCLTTACFQQYTKQRLNLSLPALCQW